MWSAVLWKTHESNFRAQATFQFSLAAMQNKSWHYWMIQYNQSWFKKMQINHQNTVFYELWQRKLKMGPQPFEYPLYLIAQNSKKWHKIQKSNRLWKPLAVVSSILSTGNFFQTISTVFGIKKSTIPTIY